MGSPDMKADDILAVVVSYNGLGRISQTVDRLLGQVGEVHIVDNGSGAESLAVLESLKQQPGVTVELLGVNRGVGHALNLGVNRARQAGYAWLLTMDQDTLVDGSLARAYGAAIDRNPDLVCLTARISGAPSRKAEGGVLAYAITSGNLVRVRLFDEIGLYDEGFFVDMIDFDFSLRLRKAGHAVERVPEAVMHHHVGDVAPSGGFLRRFYTQHSAVRRYYQYRNFLYLVERHGLGFPAFIAKLSVVRMIHLLLIGIHDPQPLSSYRAVACGVRDYLARRQGPWVERVG